MKQHYKTLILTLFFTWWAGSTYAQITVDATAGTPSAGYTTLKAAFDAINIGTHQGVIDIRVHANTTEAATCTLVESGNVSGALFTSVLIRPADTATVEKVITYSVAGSSQVTFSGSDSVTIDGRPLGLGASKLLRLNHTGTTAGSHNITLNNGVNAFSLRYCNFTHSANTAVVASNVLLSTSVAPLPPNSNIKIQNCKFQGARTNIYFSSTAANPMDSIEIVRNEFVDFANAAILSTTGSFKKVLIDSNVIYQTVNSTTAPTAIDIRHNVLGTVLTITRNHIYDMQTATTNFIRGIVVSPATASTGTIILVANNYISLMKDGGSGATVRGFEFGGAGDAVCRFINNTIRIGGTHTGGSAGQVVSLGIFKSNTSTLSTWVCRNNLSINNRTGGTTGLFHSAAWASGNGTGFVGTYDIDYNTYWATGGASNGPFPAVWNATLQPQTGQTAYRNAAAPSEQHSVFGNANFISSTNLNLTGTSINDYVNLGTPLNAFVTTDITGSTRINPTYKGAYQSTPFTNRIDGSVKEVYTLGKLPIPYANPHVIRANIQNTGIDTIFAQKVYVNVAGANTFIDSVMIDTIAPGANKYAVFSPYSYFNAGAGTVTVSLPIDSTNSNNAKTFNQIVTTGTYAYADPTLPAIGGVGFNGVGGDFIAKFPYSGSNNINQVGVNFNTGGQPFQIVIFSVVNDTPGTLLWNSTTLTSTAGINTISVNPIVPVSGTFFVGVRQTGTTNVAFGYQSEDPIRDGVFYYKATTVTAWNDFASTNSAFRFMVEPRLQIADDIGAQSVISPCNVVVQNSPSLFPKVTVFNFGVNSYSSVTVKSSMTGPGGFTYSDNTFFPSVSLSSNTSSELTLSTPFNPTLAGTYTMKVWTELSGDLEPNNDTITYVFTVVNNNTFTNSGNHIVLNGTNQSITVPYNGSLDFTGSMLSLESWVSSGGVGNKYIFAKEQTGGLSQYELYTNLAGAVTFKLRTMNGVDSIVSTKTLQLFNYTHVAATYDGNEMKLYINGDTAGTKSMSGTLMSNTNPLYIGQSYAAGTSFWNGNIDEAKVWDTVRTDHQIRTALHTRSDNFSNAHLKGYWRMDEAAGSYVSDAAGNCNNGILNGAPTFATSNITLGTPVVESQTINISGATAFNNAAVTVNSFNQSGDNQFYIHKFAVTPKGTSPITSPGGVINVSGNTWFMYKYGSGTMDSSIVDFTVSGVPATPVPADIKLFSREVGSDGNWVKLRDSATAMSFATQKVSMMITPVEFNKQFAIGANSNALPVKLIYFNGKRTNADVQLTWVTASETDNAGFSVERSTNGKSFEKIGYVGGKGNTTKTNNYSLVDENAFTKAISKTLYYRLVQTDFNGKQTISQTVIVNANSAEETITAIYPNPFNSELTFTIDSKIQTAAKILVMDVAGKKVVELTHNLNTGMNTIETSSLSQLPKGIYMVQLNINGQLTNHKLVKQ